MDILMTTQCFPYGSGEEFIKEEIEQSPSDIEIWIFAQNIGSTLRKTPSNVHVLDNKLIPRWKSLLRTTQLLVNLQCLMLLYRSLRNAAERWPIGGRSLQVIKCYVYSCKAASTIDHILRMMPQIRVAYTYWFDYTANGLCILKASQRWAGKIVCKAHGVDLYRERNKYGFIPLRTELLTYIDIVGLEGHGSKDYFRDTFVKGIEKKAYGLKLLETPLGIRGARPLTKQGAGNDISLLTVAYLNSNKDFSLTFRILEGCLRDSRFKNCHLKWTIIGSGPMITQIEAFKRSIEERGLGLSVVIKGQMNNAEVLEYYKKNVVDLYLCTSTRFGEGTCYAVLEALSHGVPVCSTSAGEIPFYLSEEIGYCIQDRSNIREFIDAIADYETYRSVRMKKRCFEYTQNKRDSKILYGEWWRVVQSM